MSNTTIWKFPLTMGNTEIQIPANAHVLSVQMQGDTITLWAWVNPAEPLVTRTFRIFGTGFTVDEDAGFDYWDTVQDRSGFVWHIFEDAPMTSPTEHERLALKALERVICERGNLAFLPSDIAIALAEYVMAREAGFHREGAPRTPAPAVDLLAAGRRAMHRYRSICGKWKVEHGEAWMPAERIEELWRSVAAAALSQLHNTQPTLDQSASKSRKSVAVCGPVTHEGT